MGTEELLVQTDKILDVLVTFAVVFCQCQSVSELSVCQSSVCPSVSPLASHSVCLSVGQSVSCDSLNNSWEVQRNICDS